MSLVAQHDYALETQYPPKMWNASVILCVTLRALSVDKSPNKTKCILCDGKYLTSQISEGVTLWALPWLSSSLLRCN